MLRVGRPSLEKTPFLPLMRLVTSFLWAFSICFSSDLISSLPLLVACNVMIGEFVGLMRIFDPDQSINMPISRRKYNFGNRVNTTSFTPVYISNFIFAPERMAFVYSYFQTPYYSLVFEGSGNPAIQNWDQRSQEIISKTRFLAISLFRSLLLLVAS